PGKSANPCRGGCGADRFRHGACGRSVVFTVVILCWRTRLPQRGRAALLTALAGLCYCLAGLSSGFALLVLALVLGGVCAATQHPIGSALVTRAFSGARSLKAFGAYNFAGDVGKVLLPATATSLLLILPWRPAYTLLGLVGIVAAMLIAILTPKVAPEPRPPSAKLALGERGEGDTARQFGFRILVLFGITDSVVRGSFFVCLPFLLIGKGASVTTAGFALTLVFIGGAAGK